MRGVRSLCLVWACQLGWQVAVAESLPLQLTAFPTNAVNLQSTNGVPLSGTPGDPYGSDGRAPVLPAAPTVGQYQSFMTFGSVVAPAAAGSFDPAGSFVGNAVNTGVPVGKDQSQKVVVVMSAARVGAMFFGRQTAYLFGSEIPVPEVAVDGGNLPAGVRKEDYWVGEPWTTNNHGGDLFYWSPHSQKVYATQPGPISVTWRKATPVPKSEYDAADDKSLYVLISGNYYRLYTVQYIVSGSAVKKPRTIYWTEGVFQGLGKPVNVPKGLVSAVQIVYNSNFSNLVAHEFQALGQTKPTDGTTNQMLEELHTLWYDATQGQIRAYNLEGRAFLELLGDPNPDGVTYKSLGTEIVDVFQQPNPNDVTTELGEKLTAYPPEQQKDDSSLFPDPVDVAGKPFFYQHIINGSDRAEFYATVETKNKNDVQVYWMEVGEEGLRWPFLFVRYAFVWPLDVAKYSHYVRPVVANEQEAKATAVPLPTSNVPIIEYQDPLDQPRGKLTEKYEYYTYLTPLYPVHRALLRFNSGDSVAFERVLSWLDVDLKTPANFAGGTALDANIATNLMALDPGTGALAPVWDTNSLSFHWPDNLVAPRVENVTVNVGDRILAPPGEIGSDGTTNYLAGSIRQELGTSFDPTAYLDPFASGFDTAQAGAIIPVNAIPGSNQLEVWWFRKNQVDLSKGFKNVFWPSVIGHYTLVWPTNGSQIVLASNKGSGPLASLQAKGQIYYQNDSTLPGYNPNEEHAFMQGGQAWALRDDLNITTPGPGYSSAPYVLLRYTESDGRPAMRAFQVVRETDTIKFDYLISAGTILQPPMPLPLMEKPFAPKLIGKPPLSLNREQAFWNVADSSTDGTDLQLVTSERSIFPAYGRLALQNLAAAPLDTRWFYPTNVSADARSLSGFVSTNAPYRVTNSPVPAVAIANQIGYEVDQGDPQDFHASDAVIVADPIAGTNWPAAVVGLTTNANSGQSNVVVVQFAGSLPTGSSNAVVLIRPQTGLTAHAFQGWRLASEALPPAVDDTTVRDRYASFLFQDRKGNLWVYRGPHDEGDSPSVSMQFYYKTLPGFYFPAAGDQQPQVGTVTPYLRAVRADGSYEGDPVFGNKNNDQKGDGNSLLVRYRPAWPPGVPVLQMAETLTVPKRGLPAIRGQSSLEILYQQPQYNGGLAQRAVVLHDPTREKEFDLGPKDGSALLGKLPASVKTQDFRGLTYFPNLPPHLSDRFFFDANRGSNGALVLQGRFVDDPVGEKYLLLNVLGVADLAALQGLVNGDDPDRDKWYGAVNGLATALEKFVENPNQPGNFIPSSEVNIGPDQLAEITSSDIAVDSYALTAVGPGTGYVTLVAGNGLYKTPPDEPVSLEIIKVVKTLAHGEVKVLLSSNPLNEKVTLQQVLDLAGKASDYSFEWKIAAPVDGAPPPVYQLTPTNLLTDGTWSHVPFPLPTDAAATIQTTPDTRMAQDVGTSVFAVSQIGYASVTTNDGKLHFVLGVGQSHKLVPGNQVVMKDTSGFQVYGTVGAETSASEIVVSLDPGQSNIPPAFAVSELDERVVAGQPQSVVFRKVNLDPSRNYSQIWLSLNLDTALGARVYIDGQLLAVANTGTNDTTPSTPPANLAALGLAYRLGAEALAGGQVAADGSVTHFVAVELLSQASPGSAQAFNLRLQALEAVDITDQQWLPLEAGKYPDGVRAILGGTADVRTLSDNYLIMRYQARSPSNASWQDDGQGNNTAWSQWTDPQLAEGWIKRVLAGINPFNQRVTDLFNNSVNTEVSMLTQAGHRWEGDVALNLDSINNYGLIEIYETVLRRGRILSIDGGINYGPANDALLLAAGYLNDLYMMEGNEAWADAANPTIGIGTKDNTYGDIATSMFSFMGEEPSLLEEELALDRGRDDFLQPGVQTPPVYNRLFWNYTRGIASGEVIYALNYDILDKNHDGVVDAADAAIMYPQGHGDAYGHYLTALKGYYSLLMNTNFDWVPKAEAVLILGKPVAVDYQDERKFAGAAAAVARTGKQVFDLTWRRDYQPVKTDGWGSFSATRANTQTGRTRYWGMDHWASRVGQGAFLNWVVGNALLPPVDPDPAHEGIQKIDRTTVPELKELTSIAGSLQTAMDNAEAGMTPLGLPESTVPFDLNPALLTQTDPQTHFEQIHGRATSALNNAVIAFDDAKDVTRLMRSEQDSLADFQAGVDKQELAYTNALIELYGTPYPEDIGPGKTYKQGYEGPDYVHYMYVDSAELTIPGMLEPQKDVTWKIDTQTFTPSWVDANGISDFNFIKRARSTGADGNPTDPSYDSNTNLYVQFNLNSAGFYQKPGDWAGKRTSPGKIQQAISDIFKARNAAFESFYKVDAAKGDLDWALAAFDRKKASHNTVRDWQQGEYIADQVVASVKFANDLYEKYVDATKQTITRTFNVVKDSLPTSLIAGLADGGDLSAPARGALEAAGFAVDDVTEWSKVILYGLVQGLDFANERAKQAIDFYQIDPEEWNQELRDATGELRDKVYGVQNLLPDVNAKLQALDDAKRNYQSLLAEANRIQQEREIFRQRTAAVVQGYRVRDAAFRLFRNEKLERYKTLFDLAAQYAFMAAQAYDYETGLLYTDQGRQYISQIINSRALGVVKDGQPQFAGSSNGDPGLSSALAQMYADWSVLKGRLGFNNPDEYGTTVSLRTEKLRILPGSDGDQKWKDALNRYRMDNVLDDTDVRRYCMQIDPGNGLPVPGLVIDFSTVIADGLNLFGNQLAAGDHNFSPSSFATKIYSLGVALEGYQGMEDPTAPLVTGGGGTTPAPPPSGSFLDPNALAATPYVYLVPVGVDSMRSPPLGDTSVIRTWSVDDVSVPLPFNIGGSGYSSKPLWQSSDSLTEPLFSVRKHQAFRPVADAQLFNRLGGFVIQPSEFTNSRLIGRSVWNSKWKLVIPGQTLLSDPNEGLDRFLRTVTDIKLRFVTYSYAGN